MQEVGWVTEEEPRLQSGSFVPRVSLYSHYHSSHHNVHQPIVASTMAACLNKLWSHPADCADNNPSCYTDLCS